jgi:hypothetical protein
MTNFRPLEGLQQGLGQCQPTGLNHNPIELIGLLKHRFHRGKKVVLNGATEAAIGQFHDGWSGDRLVLIAYLAALQQLSINAHLAKLIDQNRQPLLRLPQEFTQNCGFASTKESGDHRHR